MIMTLSGGGGILSLIVPILKLLEVNALCNFLNMVIVSSLQIFRVIRENLGVLWYREYWLWFIRWRSYFDYDLVWGRGYSIPYSAYTKRIQNICFWKLLKHGNSKLVIFFKLIIQKLRVFWYMKYLLGFPYFGR